MRPGNVPSNEGSPFSCGAGFSVNLPMRLPFPDGQAVQRLLSMAWGSCGAGPQSAAVCVLFPPGVPLQPSTFPPGQVPLKENGSWHRATVGHFLASCDRRAFQFQEVSSAAPRRGHLLPTADALHLMASSWSSWNRKQAASGSLSPSGHLASLCCEF